MVCVFDNAGLYTGRGLTSTAAEDRLKTCLGDLPLHRPTVAQKYRMENPASHRHDEGLLMRAERGSASTVILAIGAAALLGWLAVELYVKIVTLD